MSLVNSLFVDFSMHPNKRFDKPGMTKLTIDSLLACSRTCYDQSDCLFFGFTTSNVDGLGNCELHNETRQTRNLIDQAGYVYGEGEFIPARVRPSCEKDGQYTKTTVVKRHPPARRRFTLRKLTKAWPPTFRRLAGI
jgi:hypothetical protein